jgi:hypothetical protein
MLQINQGAKIRACVLPPFTRSCDPILLALQKMEALDRRCCKLFDSLLDKIKQPDTNIIVNTELLSGKLAATIDSSITKYKERSDDQTITSVNQYIAKIRELFGKFDDVEFQMYDFLHNYICKLEDYVVDDSEYALLIYKLIDCVLFELFTKLKYGFYDEHSSCCS